MISEETALKREVTKILNEEYQKESEIIHELQVLYEKCKKEDCAQRLGNLYV